ncbi:type III restriction protein res subunit, partial [mine drainage metagenome]
MPPFVAYDERIQGYRCPAYEYFKLKELYPESEDHVFENESKLNFTHSEKLRSYQQKAIDLWSSNNKKGVVVLPTAAGKTHIGID